MIDGMQRPNQTLVGLALPLYFNSQSYRFTSKSIEAIAKMTHIFILE
jgi:hypothetical protein